MQPFRSTTQQIEWRRNQVLELRSEGLSQSEIARKLNIHKSIISRDMKILNEYARKSLESHIHEKIPQEYQLCMTGLASSSKVDEKIRLQALGLVNDCYKYKMDMVTFAVIYHV